MTQPTQAGMIRAGHKLNLPLWLAADLANRDVVEFRNPSYMTEKFIQALKAGSEVMNVRLQSNDLYKNATKVGHYLRDELTPEFLEAIRDAFVERSLRLIVDKADSAEISTNDQFTHDIQKLDNLERELFDIHRRQKLRFLSKKQAGVRQVEINLDMMDEEMKLANKKLKM